MADNFDTCSDSSFIIAAAGRCVACGLCLPHCPTYQLAKLETESPRGRISLLAALASGELAASKGLDGLLQHCLLCRACEKMCPSSVPFSRIMDQGRFLHRQMIETRSILNISVDKLIDFTFAHPEWLRLGAHLVWPLKFLPKMNTDAPKDQHQTKRSFADYLPSIKLHKSWNSYYSADRQATLPVNRTHTEVSLFLGCVSRFLDIDTLDDTLYILNKIGYSVSVPQQQACCGALSLHAGRREETLKLMQKNVQAFASENPSAIVCTASGCGATLSEYHHFLQDNGFSDRVDEICHFIDSNWPDEITVSAQNIDILLHTPCSLNNSSADTNAPLRLLSKFKNIRLSETRAIYSCCGAAGTKMLTATNVSNSLRDPLLDQIREQAPDYVVTSNYGCALHLSEGLRTAGINIPVKHPVSLVAEILRKSEA